MSGFGSPKHIASFLTRMLLHVVKPSLPVQFDVDLLTLLQGRADEMHSLWTLSHHTQDWDTSDRPMIIRLGVMKRHQSQIKFML